MTTTPPADPALTDPALTGPAPTAPPLALGAMSFGTTIAEDDAFVLLDAYVAAGGVWIDTADCYAFWTDESGQGGASELLLGRWLAARPGVRERVRIATKVGCEPLYPGSYPEFSQGLAPDVVRRVAAQSLERMGIDHIDLFWAHRDDRAADLAQTVEAFAGLVDDGVVGRWGYSNTALWRVERAAERARAQGITGPSAIQLRYTYLQPRPFVRDHDHDHRFGWITDEVLDYAASNPGIDLWAYTPLLYGAYDRPDRQISDAFTHPGTTRRLEVLAEVARELGVTRSEVVLAWLAGGDPVVRPVAGASTLAQVEAALAGVRLTLPPEARERLDAPW